MLRRQIRERQEYLFKRAQQTKQHEIEQKKRALKAALEAGKPIPTELRGEEPELRRLLALDDQQKTDVRDDEYRKAGVEDPRIMITTSRDPSARLKQFTKEMKLLFPTAQRLNRGGTILKELVQVCRDIEVTDLIIVHERRGEPDGLIVSHMPYGPTAYFTLSNVVMRHDIEDPGKMSEANPHLIFHGFSTPLGERVTSILKFLFPVPRDDTRRVMTFANDSDYISFRHHVYTKKGKEVELAEIGPRFEMKLYHIKLGTVDQDDADTEWVYRPYMNTAKKRTFL
ncbi:U3 small nucleolar ribonucleoprotein IMP4 [Salpingoeca rosetta]|uniref:U3 small nucleolar ribonucleoprotein IMP4 n=1 Tax=Salpingoeca rosetta (strain ATCC 50818 / BSB-021) TaxID=946362 RepID=F2TXT2_SALR5|nr:U3 small nucleolar ribonucleoprotein IMP4 [Salpingoeca rosetta]EGD76191.1 U3 small nucleolar ribonucleoprotein IMP4 [Salpingoeca rosetta]|eukprot:XP_004998366.1 U3 small nucleolar ribonucleoprotein IMP4 [Salpingoeca rosetta]